MPFSDQQQTLLEDLFRTGAVVLGQEVRARFGLNSPIYFNLREPLYTRPGLLWDVAREFALKICQLAPSSATPQCVVGIPDSATPLAVAASLYARQNELRPEITCALLRKKAKAYPGLPAAHWMGPKDSRYEYNLLDDVVASGLTKRSAAAKMREEGIALRRIVVLFDRQQGDGLRQEGFEVHGIFNVSDVLDFYLQRSLISASDYQRIKDFLSTHNFAAGTLAR